VLNARIEEELAKAVGKAKAKAVFEHFHPSS